ncbi:XkdX family protein [Pullulanibacillus sp. KACC 23026]|nr:XkdX family protein [Pullulanibacillus sp. KACC 23026]WEG14169.1 XkdX family protein [Pullulanibacillus sp. KACC 23026]
MSAVYANFYKDAWKNGVVTSSDIDTAVSKGYLTQQEANQIKALPQSP